MRSHWSSSGLKKSVASWDDSTLKGIEIEQRRLRPAQCDRNQRLYNMVVRREARRRGLL